MNDLIDDPFDFAIFNFKDLYKLFLFVEDSKLGSVDRKDHGNVIDSFKDKFTYFSDVVLLNLHYSEYNSFLILLVIVSHLLLSNFFIIMLLHRHLVLRHHNSDNIQAVFRILLIKLWFLNIFWGYVQIEIVVLHIDLLVFTCCAIVVLAVVDDLLVEITLLNLNLFLLLIKYILRTCWDIFALRIFVWIFKDTVVFIVLVYWSEEINFIWNLMALVVSREYLKVWVWTASISHFELTLPINWRHLHLEVSKCAFFIFNLHLWFFRFIHEHIINFLSWWHQLSRLRSLASLTMSSSALSITKRILSFCLTVVKS